MNHKWCTFGLISSILLITLLAGCGAGTAGGGQTTAAPASAINAPLQHNAADTNTGASNGQAQKDAAGTNGQQAQQKGPTGTGGPQYLIKTLKVSMAVSDTRKAADDLQTWISSTDPKSSSAGMDYEQAGDNLYNITLTFSVQASMYPQIERYLSGYAPQQKGQLLQLNETVQDVSNDYVDNQSQLANLRVEQGRLQSLLSHAQSLGDTITIEQKLTEVEGNIERIEAHLNALTNQVTYYNVTITLQPISTTPPPQPANSGWNIGQIFHDAFAASLALAQGLVTFLIWLLAFSVYLIPVVLISWFVMRWRRTQHSVPPPTPKV